MHKSWPLFLIIVYFLIGCNRNHVTNQADTQNNISLLLSQSENSSLPVPSRLSLAATADSLATQANDLPGQLKCKKILGTLFLKSGNLKSAQAYLLASSVLASQTGDTKTKGVVLNDIGIVFYQLSEYDSAIKYYRLAGELFQVNNDALHLAQAQINAGMVYKIQGSFDSALNATLAGARILDSLNKKSELATVYTTLGNILKELKRPDDAMQYLQQALEIREQEKDSAAIASSLNNIGNVYRLKKDYQNALACYQRALTIKEKRGLTKAAANTIDNIAEVYYELKKFDKAEEYFLKALSVRSPGHDKEGYLTTANKLTQLYLGTNDLHKALSVAMGAYSQTPATGMLKQRSDNAILLSEIFAKRQEFDQAFRFSSAGMALKDSLFSSSMAETVAGLEAKYKSEQKDKELRLSKAIQTAQKHQLKWQYDSILLLAGITLLLIAIALLLYRAAKFRKTARTRVEMLMAELNHRVKNNLQIIADILNLQLHATSATQEVAVIQSIRSRVQSMGILHSLLYKGEYSGSISMTEFFEELMSNLSHSYSSRSREFQISLAIHDLKLNTKQAIPVGLIVNEIVTNIFKHAQIPENNALLVITLTETDGLFLLEISDNFGFWEQSKNNETQSGFGLNLVRSLVRQLAGTHEINIRVTGTTHRITFRKNR